MWTLINFTMILQVLVKNQVFLVLVLVFSYVLSQNAETPLTDSPEPTSEVICQICNCTVPNVVDCTNREIKDPFEIQDWEGLKSFSPTTVDLSHNALTTITRLSTLPIKNLNYSNCEISSIEDSSFVYLSDLVSLDISRNKIPTSGLSRRAFMGALTPDIGLLPFSKLRYLSLAHNDIHSLPQDIFAFMPGLTTLDLSGNPLAFIDQVTMAAITDLVNLRLSVSGCELESLPDGLFRRQRRLLRLDLSDNRFTTVPAVLAEGDYLIMKPAVCPQELSLSGCELESLPDGLFRRQRRLLRLDLSDNRFTTVPSVLAEASNLVYLNFGKNALEVLPTENAIRNLTKLQDLRLCRNSKLNTIESTALGGLPNLVSLHICNNPRLTSVHADFLMYMDDHDVESWPVLTEFYLNNNNLSEIDSGFVHRWDQLVKIDFTNNPYVCDCKNQWVVDVLTPKLIAARDTGQENMICKKPQELRGISFGQLYANNKTLVCPESENFIELPIPDMAIILGIMIGIFVTFPLVLVVVLLWRKGYFARCRSQKEEEDDEETDAF